MKVNPSVQGGGAVGEAKETMVGMIVGGSGSSFCVGGIAVTSFEGGMYGVGVRAGWQACTKIIVEINISRMKVALFRITVVIKKIGARFFVPL
jgi:hypothetical protein